MSTLSTVAVYTLLMLPLELITAGVAAVDESVSEASIVNLVINTSTAVVELYN